VNRILKMRMTRLRCMVVLGLRTKQPSRSTFYTLTKLHNTTCRRWRARSLSAVMDSSGEHALDSSRVGRLTKRSVTARFLVQAGAAMP